MINPSRALKVLLCFVANLLLVLLFQVLSGTYSSELAHWPDEPSHAASALMVRDYIVSHSPPHPIRFAEIFYAHYPKSAIGIWPPLYYLVAACWLLLFGVSNTSFLTLTAVVTATLATLVAVFAEKLFGYKTAVAIGLLFVVLPQIVIGQTMFMLDIPVALMQFIAMWAFIKLVRTERVSWAIAFGILVALATLIKGNAIALVLIPVFFILLTGRWRMLIQKQLYLLINNI